MARFRVFVGASLSLALVLAGPGLAPYQALAAEISGKDGARSGLPDLPAAPRTDGGLPALPPAAPLPDAAAPALSPAGGVSPAVPARTPELRPEVPGPRKEALGIGERLAQPLPELAKVPADGAKEGAGRDFEERAFGLGQSAVAAAPEAVPAAIPAAAPVLSPAPSAKAAPNRGDLLIELLRNKEAAEKSQKALYRAGFSASLTIVGGYLLREALPGIAQRLGGQAGLYALGGALLAWCLWLMAKIVYLPIKSLVHGRRAGEVNVALYRRDGPLPGVPPARRSQKWLQEAEIVKDARAASVVLAPVLSVPETASAAELLRKAAAGELPASSRASFRYRLLSASEDALEAYRSRLWDAAAVSPYQVMAAEGRLRALRDGLSSELSKGNSPERELTFVAARMSEVYDSMGSAPDARKAALVKAKMLMLARQLSQERPDLARALMGIVVDFARDFKALRPDSLPQMAPRWDALLAAARRAPSAP